MQHGSRAKPLYYIWSNRHNAGIIYTNILQHNAFVSENCDKCIQILPATRFRMCKVDKSGNILGTRYLRLVPSAFSMLLGFGSSNAGLLEKDI